ncbi:MAG: cell division protein ZipA C-terminal FtsZ-binding domain-containing protein [Candidatus Methylumidiphilus sp.]
MDQLDTATLRWLLAGIGAIVIAAVYIWGSYKAKLLDFIFQRGEYDELDIGDERPKPTPPKPTKTGGGIAATVREEPAAPTLSFDDVDDNEYFSMGGTTPVEPPRPETPQAEPAPSRSTALGAPFLIQISIVATDDGYFDGVELRDALDDLRLIYGDMGIYHRYDRDYRVPLFSVASLVEPGTFPIKDMENFECPGIVLFFQPPQVNDPINVFDDLVTTCHGLAVRLGGEEWDEKRQPLTAEKISQMRARLREAY